MNLIQDPARLYEPAGRRMRESEHPGSETAVETILSDPRAGFKRRES